MENWKEVGVQCLDISTGVDQDQLRRENTKDRVVQATMSSVARLRAGNVVRDKVRD